MSTRAIAHRELTAATSYAGEVFVRAPGNSLATAVRRAADVVMDALLLLAVVLAIPFVILAVGIPVALVAQLLLQIGRLL
jgi:hypothetical protein